MKLLLYRKSLLKIQLASQGLLVVQAHVITEGDGESVSELMAGWG